MSYDRYADPKYKKYIYDIKNENINPGGLLPSPIKEIYEEIFVYENFLPEHLEKKYLQVIKSLDKWDFHNSYIDSEPNASWLNDRISLDFTHLNDKTRICLSELYALVSDVLTPEYMPFPHFNFIRMLPGEKSPLYATRHKNNPTIHDLNISVYLGEWTGGDLVFPKLNFSYSPKPRDLLIFKSDYDYKYYIDNVESGERYSWITYGIKHPGYFPM
jgi:hypothetical protein